MNKKTNVAIRTELWNKERIKKEDKHRITRKLTRKEKLDKKRGKTKTEQGKNNKVK